MKLSKRIRAGSEAAPWMVDKIQALETEVEHLRLKLARVRDAIKFAANSKGGIVAEIDAVLAEKNRQGR